MLKLTQKVFSQKINNTRFLSLYDSHLEIDENLKIHYIWLRDHCRCEKCYNQKTNQIMSDVLKIPKNIKPVDCVKINDKLKITWKDGHLTEFSLNYLSNLYKTTKLPQNESFYWNSNQIKNIKELYVTSKEYFKKDQTGLKLVLKNILKYGIGFVTEVEPSIESTEKVVRNMAPVQQTLFGGMWEVSNNLEHADTAYTTIELGAHNDNTYFTEASGLQVFHMLSHDGEGGETLLVDGFNAANNLKERHPKDYEILTTFPIESEYIEKNVHYTTIDTVLKQHPVTKKLSQIRYNIYDRAPLNTLNFEEIPMFYDAYKRLGEEINKEEQKYWLKLNPGTVIFIDNFRVLHGRASYSGFRRLTGCYVARNEWTSTAKNLGLHLY
ncbi:trimethyllysine dioxygenase, mitochondrial [Onthophagus taurus]|uniref:trimethyllysine dioxygenase, mitochondrial n=1 Tax=Onthophagus taurus TaxID=166361 RepID=UPI0039BE79E7